MKVHTNLQKSYYYQVIETYQKTGFSSRKMAKLDLFPVGESTMRGWIANFEAENGKGSPQAIMKARESQTNEELEALKAKVADLENQLRREKLRNRLNEKIIDIAEERWHIDIRKKAGTKQ